MRPHQCVVAQIGGNAFETTDRNRFPVHASSAAGGLAGTVTGATEYARKDVRFSIEEVRLGMTTLRNEPDVLRHVRVGRARPLAVDDPVVVGRV
jgi:hypothetical protein